jgi:hypothetical protein
MTSASDDGGSIFYLKCLVLIHQITWNHIPEDHNLNEDFNPHILYAVSVDSFSSEEQKNKKLATMH